METIMVNGGNSGEPGGQERGGGQALTEEVVLTTEHGDCDEQNLVSTSGAQESDQAPQAEVPKAVLRRAGSTALLKGAPCFVRRTTVKERLWQQFPVTSQTDTDGMGV